MKIRTKIFLVVAIVAVFPVVSAAVPVKWETYKDGMKRGAAEKVKIFVNFHADW